MKVKRRIRRSGKPSYYDVVVVVVQVDEVLRTRMKRMSTAILSPTRDSDKSAE